MGAQVRGLLRLVLSLPIQLRQQDLWLEHALPILRATYIRPHPALAPRTSLEFLRPLWGRQATRTDLSLGPAQQ
ncbi:MAG: hypothetical protein JWM42_1391 [Burkholderia sp.]|nr:hypothetical protein [Burkholderia sp.]